MSRRERIVETVHRIAEVHEKEAILGLGRAEQARRQASAEVEALAAENAAAEAQLTGSGELGALERELLWAHRSWFRRELEHSEERLALTEAEVQAAQARLSDRKRETRIRERVMDHVQGEARAERAGKAQKELDDLVSARAPRGE